MTIDDALSLATRLHPSNGVLPDKSDVKPTIPEAIALIHEERRTCGFNWITGRVAEEVLRDALAQAGAHS